MRQLPLEPVLLSELQLEHDDLPPIRLTRGDLAGMVQSIRDHGLLSPPVVWKRLDPGGEFQWVVLDGIRRVLALRKMEEAARAGRTRFPLSRIKVFVFEGDREHAIRVSAILHLSTAPLERGDAAVATEMIVTAGRPWTQMLTASLVGRHQTWVSQSVTVVQGLAAPVLDMFRRSHKMKLIEALDLVEIKTAGGQPDVAQQIATAEQVGSRIIVHPDTGGRRAKRPGPLLPRPTAPGEL